MLPKSERFTKEDFQGVRPKVFFRDTVIDIAKVSLPTQKIACVISKKTLKRAVDRNYAKRRVYTIIGTLPLPPKDSFVFYLKKDSISIPYSRLEEIITQAFATLH